MAHYNTLYTTPRCCGSLQHVVVGHYFTLLWVTTLRCCGSLQHVVVGHYSTLLWVTIPRCCGSQYHVVVGHYTTLLWVTTTRCCGSLNFPALTRHFRSIGREVVYIYSCDCEWSLGLPMARLSLLLSTSYFSVP